jgi:drug/metabolite transporter (DMT)-like permease
LIARVPAATIRAVQSTRGRERDASATSWQLLLAFAIVYIVWGSTYLAIRFAVESIPPLLMAGTRFLAAGGVLYALSLARSRATAPHTHGEHSAGARVATRARWTAPGATGAQWRAAFITGLFLISASYGLVSWAELTVPSGIVAVVTAMTPLWMVVVPWATRHTRRPPALVLFGIALGLAAQALLFGVGEIDRSAIHPLGMAAVVLAGVSWAIGSLRARRADLPADPFLGSAMQMLTGGLVLVVVGLVVGEGARFSLAGVTSRSALAWAYLVVAGSMVAYSAYIYLLRATTPARASTYAYVNPIVAVFLGWLLAGEPIGWRTVAAMVLTLLAVLAINGAASGEA